MTAVMRIHELFSVVLSLSLLLSAVSPLLQMGCPPFGDQHSRAPVEDHSTDMYSHIPTSEYGLPCTPNPDPTPRESAPCSQHVMSCCALQAVPTTKVEAILLESSRTALDELTLPRLPHTLFHVNSGGTLFRLMSSSQYPACSLPPDRQAFLCTFLI